MFSGTFSYSFIGAQKFKMFKKPSFDNLDLEVCLSMESEITL